MRTMLASETRRMCVTHPNREAVAVRVVEYGKGAALPPQIVRRRVCDECSTAKVKKAAGVEVRLVPLK